MVDPSPSSDKRFALEPAAFYQALEPEEQMLVRIRDELYEGSWDKMRHDLNNRLNGRPYLFKLVSRIEHDLQRVDVLEAYEQERKIDLGEVARA